MSIGFYKLSSKQLQSCLLDSVQENSVKDVIDCLNEGASLIDDKIDFYKVAIECNALEVLKYMETKGLFFSDKHVVALSITLDESHYKVGRFLLEKDFNFNLKYLSDSLLLNVIKYSNDESLLSLVYEKMVLRSDFKEEMLLKGLKKSCACSNVQCFNFLLNKLSCKIPDEYIGISSHIDIIKSLHKRGLPLRLAKEINKNQLLLEDIFKYENYLLEVEQSREESKYLLKDIEKIHNKNDVKKVKL